MLFVVRALYLTSLISFESLFESFIPLLILLLITDLVEVIRKPLNSDTILVKDRLDEDVELHLLIVGLVLNACRKANSHGPFRRLPLTACSMNQFLFDLVVPRYSKRLLEPFVVPK